MKNALAIFLALTVVCRVVEADSVKQIPIAGNAWHIALADTDGDGESEIICACYHGEVYCLDRDSGVLKWKFQTGGFPFDLTAADIDGDGKAEIFVASADCNVYALKPDGGLLWKFGMDFPAYQVSVGNIDGKKPLEVAAGGAGRTTYILSAEGKVLSATDFRDATRHVRVGDIDGDGLDEIIVCMHYGDMTAHKGIEMKQIWRRQLRRHAQWGRKSLKHWRPYSIDLRDIDGDGRCEILMGSGFYDGNDIRVLDGTGDERWAVLEGFAARGQGFFYAFTNIIAGDLLPSEGMEVITVTGPRLKIFSRGGKLLAASQAPMGFADVAVSDGEIFLASAPNGDTTLYRVKPRNGWEEEFRHIKYQGLMAEIEKTLENIRQKVLNYKGVPPRKPDSPYFYMASGGNPNTEQLISSHFGLHRAFHKVFPYQNIRTAMYWSVHCVNTVPGFGRSRAGILNVESRLLTEERIVELARYLEDNEQYFLMDVGHGCTPQVRLEVCERVLQVAPKYLIGFMSSENSKYDERLEKYLREYWVPLMDLCLKYGKKKAVLIEKGAWWVTIPAMKKYYDLLFDGRYRDVLIASVEDSNSRSPELNLAGRVGLWLTGCISGFSVRTINDEVCWNRYWEWEFPMTGHPFLRQAIAHAALGGSLFELNNDTFDYSGKRTPGKPWMFSRIGRESTEIILHMLGRGIIIPPTREEVAGVSPVAILIREPDERVLKDAFSFHDFRTNQPEPDLDVAPLGHLGCYWGMSPTPAANISSYCYNKRRQYGAFIPSTPYGFVAIVPELRGIGEGSVFRRGIVTDGAFFYAGGKKNGLAYRARAIAALREGAKSLPFAVEGDAFVQVQRFNPRYYRVYAVDPGFLDPAERDVKLRVQLRGRVASVRDIINGMNLAVRGRLIEFKVPAGAFRILDIRME